MILYVDETENEEFFIVTGLLMPSKEDTDLAYKQFKKKIKNYPVSQKEKQSLYHEFKSYKLDKHHFQIKYRMLEEIACHGECIIYSTYIKKENKLFQSDKEKAYIMLLKRIVDSLETEVDIIYDTFNKKDFEKNIVLSILPLKNVTSIKSCDSVLEAGLQFVDNVCGVIRLYKDNKDEKNFYSYIENLVKEV